LLLRLLSQLIIYHHLSCHYSTSLPTAPQIIAVYWTSVSEKPSLKSRFFRVAERPEFEKRVVQAEVMRGFGLFPVVVLFLFSLLILTYHYFSFFLPVRPRF
jgi:hypothetical protein